MNDNITLTMIRNVFLDISREAHGRNSKSEIELLVLSGMAMVDIFQKSMTEQIDEVLKKINQLPQAIEEALGR